MLDSPQRVSNPLLEIPAPRERLPDRMRRVLEPKQALVDRNPIQPGPERLAGRKERGRTQGEEKRLFRRLGCLRPGPQHAASDAVDRLPVAGRQRDEGDSITALQAGREQLIRIPNALTLIEQDGGVHGAQENRRWSSLMDQPVPFPLVQLPQRPRTWSMAVRSKGMALRLRAAETAANPSTRPPHPGGRMKYLESGSTSTPNESASFATARSLTCGGKHATTSRPALEPTISISSPSSGRSAPSSASRRSA